MEVAGPLGTPLGLAQRKRASPRGDELPWPLESLAKEKTGSEQKEKEHAPGLGLESAAQLRFPQKIAELCPEQGSCLSTEQTQGSARHGGCRKYP